jgi:hypothetical protein
VTGPHPNYCFYVSPPAFRARLCCFLRVQLWTSESTKHANDAGTSKSSPSFWRSCRTKLTKEVYRFSPIWHISSVKIARALNGAVPLSNNGRQQWPLRYGNRRPIASVAVSHLGEFAWMHSPEQMGITAAPAGFVQLLAGAASMRPGLSWHILAAGIVRA